MATIISLRRPALAPTPSLDPTRGLPVVYTSGITQRAGDAISFGFIGISEIVRSLPYGAPINFKDL